MNAILGVVLWPLIAPMEALFSFYSHQTESPGWAVVLLGATMAATAEPLRRRGRTIELRLAAKIAVIKQQIALLDKTLVGEARFWALDKIYQDNRFHPAHNILSGASFLFQLPFLIAAFLILTGDALPPESAFGFIKDLSLPDGALLIADVNINILPLLMLILAAANARYCYAGARTMSGQLIPFIIFILIYSLPSGLTLYWITMMMVAAVFHFITVRTEHKPAIEDNA